MHRILKKENIFTVPNLLSVIRLLMIPAIIWLYCTAENYTATVLMVVLSGFTDVLDGIIARKCGMVSDLGKILDPLADKLTQAALILCLTVRYELMTVLIIEFVLREICMSVLGYVTIKKKDCVNSSKWYGKLTTVLLYAVLGSLILFPEMPNGVANGLITACCVSIMLAFVLYADFYRKLLQTKE